MPEPQAYDWSKFEIVFYYDQPVEQVFRCWASASGLEAFFIEKASYHSAAGERRARNAMVEKGDQFHWDWRQSLNLEGEVLNVAENSEFSFTFGDMKVQVYFSRVGSQTELYLLQSEIPDTQDGRVMGHLNCRSCWVFFLTNLKSVLDTGQDLRDASPERVSSIEVGFQPFSTKK